MLRRMRGDDALSSIAVLIFGKFIANSAGNFAMKWEVGVDGSNPFCSHHPVSRFSDIAGNRPNMRVCAICYRGRTQRASLSARFAQIDPFLSRRDLRDSLRRSSRPWRSQHRFVVRSIDLSRAQRFISLLAPTDRRCRSSTGDPPGQDTNRKVRRRHLLIAAEQPSHRQQPRDHDGLSRRERRRKSSAS
jgi:hypothetical protein